LNQVNMQARKLELHIHNHFRIQDTSGNHLWTSQL
jgi:hypothetical protein